MTDVNTDSPNDLLSYPRSRASVASDNPIVRSRTWSDDMTKTWNVPITGLETIPDRAQRYMVYFKMTPLQLRLMHDKFVSEMREGLELHRADPRAPWDNTKCSLKMVDTYVTEKLIPRGDETGTAFAIDFGGSEAGVVRALKVILEGGGKISLTDPVALGLRDAIPELPKGLLDRCATASQLFDNIAGLVKQLKEKEKVPADETMPVAFGFCFPVDQRSLTSASLIHWSKGIETGRRTIDQVEGIDVGALMDCAFRRNEVPAKTAAVINDTTGTLLTCAYTNPATMPSCRVGFIVSGGVNGCYVQPDSIHTYHYKGSVVNCELGSFDKSLPMNDVDLEVDFAATENFQLFEKMVAATYLGELCRRLVVKVWQCQAPQLAWVRHSMPWLACAQIIADTTPGLTTTQEILAGLWEWETSVEHRKLVQQLFDVVFDRSAALSAVAVVALAGRTCRLQPAMGGLTCAIGGALYSKCERYQRALKGYLSVVTDAETAKLIRLAEVTDGVTKGGGLLAVMASMAK